MTPEVRQRYVRTYFRDHGFGHSGGPETGIRAGQPGNGVTVPYLRDQWGE
ncbi:MAG: hypothetical protein ACRDRJ_30295 [Streptosporangiaceae bacterium]